MQTLALPTLEAIAHPCKILAIGDSIIYGYGDLEGGGWVDRLKRQWMLADNSGHIIYNLGVRGDGVQQVNRRLESEFSLRGELRNKFPDALIISVGVNDSARLGHWEGRNFTSLEDFTTQVNCLLDSSLRLISSEVRSKSVSDRQPSDRILCVGMVPVDEDKMPFGRSLYFRNADQYRYKEVMKEACQSRNIPYFDVFDLWWSRGKEWWCEQLSLDGLHPSSQGYRALLSDILNWEPMQKLER
jgi:lysophospholipase L1-like esterase